MHDPHDPSRSRVATAACAIHVSLAVISGCGVKALSPPPVAEQVVPTTTAALDALPLPVSTTLLVSDEDAAGYVGDVSCRGCHPQEAAAHERSGHSRTARLVDRARDTVYFADSAVFRDENLGLQHRPVRKSRELAIRASGFGVDEDLPVHLSIGSGEHGSTYVGLRDDGSAVVPMISLYRKGDRLVWNWTPGPGASRRADEPVGQTLPPEGLAQCAGCHSTVGRRRFRLETQTLGIGCERCHGPASEHLRRVKTNLDGVRSGAVPSGMPRLGALSGPQVLARCNTCHRPLGQTGPEGVPDDLARSQALGIMLSGCYRRSGGKLSCISCHDPHAPPEHRPAHYEKVCNSCHTGTAPGAVRCSVVSTRSGCIGCHMSREEMRQFNLATFANHWIRRRPGASGSNRAPQ